MVEAADDRAWFEHSVLGVLPELLGTARRLAKNREDAEDLAAEAITRAWLHRDGLRERDRFAGWILRILTNLFISRRRSEAIRPEETDLEEGPEFSLFERLHQPFLLWWGNPEKEFLDPRSFTTLRFCTDSATVNVASMITMSMAADTAAMCLCTNLPARYRHESVRATIGINFRCRLISSANALAER
jgi:DNA-directed RNA polymerase specialized sigma24 family protein